MHGQWGRWGQWSVCPDSCGPGQQIRFRRCNNPYPHFNGEDCKGKTKNRQLRDCRVAIGTECFGLCFNNFLIKLCLAVTLRGKYVHSIN